MDARGAREEAREAWQEWCVWCRSEEKTTRQHTRHETRDTRHETRDARHETRDARHETRDARRKRTSEQQQQHHHRRRRRRRPRTSQRSMGDMRQIISLYESFLSIVRIAWKSARSVILVVCHGVSRCVMVCHGKHRVRTRLEVGAELDAHVDRQALVLHHKVELVVGPTMPHRVPPTIIRRGVRHAAPRAAPPPRRSPRPRPHPPQQPWRSVRCEKARVRFYPPKGEGPFLPATPSLSQSLSLSLSLSRSVQRMKHQPSISIPPPNLLPLPPLS